MIRGCQARQKTSLISRLTLKKSISAHQKKGFPYRRLKKRFVRCPGKTQLDIEIKEPGYEKGRRLTARFAISMPAIRVDIL